MFDQKKTAEICKQSKSERWNYPKTFNALKEAGVEYYETYVADHQIVYYGDGLSFLEAVPNVFQKLIVSSRFDQEAVKQAIKKHQIEKTSYGDFLKDIALAGVKYYKVDMSKRTISYFGKASSEEYLENIPQF